MKRIGMDQNHFQEKLKRKIEIPISQSAWPAPYAHALEFNPPVHGTWNIVHIGMNIPQAHQIYVCAINCMRGVVLTAAEMNASDRFSFVILKEEDLVEGTVEDVTIEGVIDVIHKLPSLPPAVCFFPVCTHHFLGCDINRIYRELQKEFPDIDFIRGFMDPIMQKEGPTPDQKLRIAMYQPLKGECKPGKVALVGSNVCLEPQADLLRLARHFGLQFCQMPETKSYEEYKALGQAELFLANVPNGKSPAENLGRRLHREAFYFPMSFSYEEISCQLKQFADWAKTHGSEQSLVRDDEISSQLKHVADWAITSGIDMDAWIQDEIDACETKMTQLRLVIGDAPIAIDYTLHPRPLGLARFLLEHGFHVEKIYLNAFNREEEDDYLWLKEHAKDLILSATIQPGNRVIARQTEQKLLALGQQAAWFTGSPHFVNMVEGGGLYGFDGIRRMADLMLEAWEQEKDTRDLVPRKGLGCESCV